jgi:hypothetical protein
MNGIALVAQPSKVRRIYFLVFCCSNPWIYNSTDISRWQRHDVDAAVYANTPGQWQESRVPCHQRACAEWRQGDDAQDERIL